MAKTTNDALEESIVQLNQQKRQAMGFGGVKVTTAETSATLPITAILNNAEAPAPEAPATSVIPAITPEQIQQMLAAAIAPLSSQLQEVRNQATQSKEQAELAATREAEALAKAAALKSQLNGAQEQLQAVQVELTEAQKAETTLRELGQLKGRTADAHNNAVAKAQGSNVNTILSGNHDKEPGAVREFFEVQNGLKNSGRAYQKYTKSGQYFEAYDCHEIRDFVRENKQSLIKDLEKWGKQNGILRGSTGSTQIKNDATTIPNIVGGFLPVLSAIMRENNRPGFVFHQFPLTRFEYEKGLGDTIQIPRAAYTPGPRTPSDRKLSGGGAFYPIDQSNQAIRTGTEPCKLEEWGLGKDSQSPPIAIPTFVSAYSMIDLMAILERNLLFDYYQSEDLAIRSLWYATSNVLYNKKGNVTTDRATIVAGDDGTCSYQFLEALVDYAREGTILPLPDGCYGYVVPTRGTRQLKQSLLATTQFVAASPEDIENVTNFISTGTSGMVDKVSGYVGKISDCHVFTTNAYGVGASGKEGVQTESFGSGSPFNAQTRTSFLFGQGSIGRGIGTEMEIRFDEVTSFGRLDRAIWYSQEQFVPIDVDPVGAGQDPTSIVAQELRVLQVRTAAAAF